LGIDDYKAKIKILTLFGKEHSMKKLITIILVVAMIFTMCGTAMAAGETVTADIVIADKASENTVNVTYTGTESLALLKVQLDSEYPITSISSDYSCTYNPHNGLVLISCYYLDDTTTPPTFTGRGNGTVLFTINYTVPSTTANGSYPIDITVLEARKADATVMSVAALDGSLEIGTMLLGDINNDGSVNNADLVMLSQYSTGNITLTRDELARADMNGDGQITNVDVIMLSQMLTA